MTTIRCLSKQSEEAAIRAACKVLRNGGVIAFPTETVYGIGCDPRNTKAVNQLFRIKGRNEQKPIQLIAAHIRQVQQLVEVHAYEKMAMNRYWPGPLTLLLKLRSDIRLAPRVSPKRIIGIRITPSLFLRTLIQRYGAPIAATSANRSGQKPASSGRGVIRAFPNDPKPDLLIDVGRLKARKPTSVAAIDQDGCVHVHRKGSVRLPSRIKK